MINSITAQCTNSISTLLHAWLPYPIYTANKHPGQPFALRIRQVYESISSQLRHVRE